jgi:hypothetical protein
VAAKTASPAASPDAPEPQVPTGAVTAYEYVWPTATVYQHIPLTARPADPLTGAMATVFPFPDGPPDDRWQPTDQPVNQRRDNDPEGV